MMNSNVRLVLWCLIYKFRTVFRYRNWSLSFTNEICSGNDVRTQPDRVQRGPIWGQNKQFEGPCKVFKPQHQICCVQDAPTVLVRSSDQSFWGRFSWVLEDVALQHTLTVEDGFQLAFFWSILNATNFRFLYQNPTTFHDNLTPGVQCAKAILWP